MKKLIKVISSKIIRKKKGAGKEQFKSDKKFNFNFRRAKLSQKITLRSFQNYQQYTGNSILAISNFEGTQFIIKPPINTEKSIKLKQNLQNKRNLIEEDQDIAKQNKIGVPHEVERKFEGMIKRLNHQIRDLYFTKKQLSEKAPFEFSINLSLALLVVFTIGLSIFTIFNGIQNKEQYSNDNKNLAYFLFVFLLLLGTSFVIDLVLIWIVNVFYVVLKPYSFFYFDYEVMNKVAHVLMEHNRSYFREEKYIMVCDIEATWILLKPLSNSMKNMEKE